MIYSLDKLATIEVCDQKLKEINDQKEDLTVQKVTLTRKHTKGQTGSPELAADIVLLEREIAGLDAAIATYEEGELKAAYVYKRGQKFNRLTQLQQRQKGFNDMALIDQEFDVNCIDKSLAEADVLIAAINAHKAGL